MQKIIHIFYKYTELNNICPSIPKKMDTQNNQQIQSLDQFCKHVDNLSAIRDVLKATEQFANEVPAYSVQKLLFLVASQMLPRVKAFLVSKS